MYKPHQSGGSKVAIYKMRWDYIPYHGESIFGVNLVNSMPAPQNRASVHRPMMVNAKASKTRTFMSLMSMKHNIPTGQQLLLDYL